jgi:hypothetical protein
MFQSQTQSPKVDTDSGYPDSEWPERSLDRRNALGPEEQRRIAEAAKAGLYDLSVCTLSVTSQTSSTAVTGDEGSERTESIQTEK